jgi:hypothetical protein
MQNEINELIDVDQVISIVVIVWINPIFIDNSGKSNQNDQRHEIGQINEYFVPA